jgi:hypothetical protein
LALKSEADSYITILGVDMAGIVEGLFGQTPLEIRRHQEDVQRQRAQQYGAQDPMSAVRQSQYGVGAQIGNMVNSAMGQVSPEEAQAKQSQEIQSQIDTTTPEGLMRGAQMFNQVGNPQMAQRLVQAARELQKQISDEMLVKSRAAKEDAMAEKYAAWQQNEMNKLASRSDIATAGNTSRENVATAGNTSRENVATAGNTSRENVATAGNTSRENVANISANSRMSVANIGANSRTEEKPMTPAQRFKERQSEGKSTTSLRSMQTELDDAVKSAEILKNHSGLKRATGIPGFAPSIPGGDAAQAETLLTEFKAQVKRTGLNLVRQGGGIGTMTEREWPIVEGMVANIDPVKLGVQGTKDQIDKVIAKMQGVLKNAKLAHEDMYGGSSKPPSSNKPKFLGYE